MFLSERDGKVQGICSLISYEGATIKELRTTFKELWMIILPCVKRKGMPQKFQVEKSTRCG
jgi:hypothetical protein